MFQSPLHALQLIQSIENMLVRVMLLVVWQFVAPHVKQVIIDAKVGPPKFEDGLAADVFSVVGFS